ncbi:MAG: hypothetical protein E6K73_06425 [Candidatus Eisenbacteria bacterium]|uniref:Uncharacterized protein n=1 Tax=Eiseniibacteriota bacterium TaxID=2212470 RepID=A0A538SIK4_UNCEI|nr:MAG: hypothetical protein E6K73_06425 [Candidatus Eisenbacteria bacterium]
MNAKWIGSAALASTLTLFTAGLAQTTPPGGPGTDASEATAAGSERGDITTDHPVAGHTRAEKRLYRVMVRGEQLSAKTRAKFEGRLDDAAEVVDRQAKENEAGVASRLSAEFGVSAQSLVAERNALHAWWGELVIAHTLASSAPNRIAAKQVFQLHDREGMGWSQIAHGMGFDLKQTVSAVETECRVATGAIEPDGKVASIGAGLNEAADLEDGSASGGPSTARTRTAN